MAEEPRKVVAEMTVAELRELNDLRTNTLRTGQKLRVARTRGMTAGGM